MSSIETSRVLRVVVAAASLGLLVAAFSSPAFAVSSGNAIGSCTVNTARTGWILSVSWKGKDPDYWHPTWLTPTWVTADEREANTVSMDYSGGWGSSLTLVLYKEVLPPSEWPEPWNPEVKTWHTVDVVCPPLPS